MKKYIWIAGTSCDLITTGNFSTISTYAEIANRVGKKKIIKLTNHHPDLSKMLIKMSDMIINWRDSLTN